MVHVGEPVQPREIAAAIRDRIEDLKAFLEERDNAWLRRGPLAGELQELEKDK